MEKNIRLILLGLTVAILALFNPAIATGEWIEKGAVVSGGGPAIIQDEEGVFWLAYDYMSENNRDIYIIHSKDMESWSEPIRITDHNKSDFHPTLVQTGNGVFYLAFTSQRRGNYDIYLVKSEDGLTWSEPIRLTEAEESDWYSFITIDSKGRFILSYTSSREVDPGIYIRTSDDGERWSEEYRATDTKKDIYPIVVEGDEGYWLLFVRHTGDYSIRTRANEHELFLTYSPDLLEWKRFGRLTYTKTGKFSLYPSFIRDKAGNFWISYTSNELGNEELYIIGSKDGTVWSIPERISRNMEYRESSNSTVNFKCDQKSLIQDRGGEMVIAYNCAREGGGIFILSGMSELYLSNSTEVTFDELFQKGNLDTLDEGSTKNGNEIIIGVILFFAAILTIMALKRKKND
jgi:hypothetical protein